MNQSTVNSQTVNEVEKGTGTERGFGPELPRKRHRQRLAAAECETMMEIRNMNTQTSEPDAKAELKAEELKPETKSH